MRNKIFYIVLFFVLFFFIFTIPIVQASLIENAWYNTLTFLGIIEITKANHLNSDRVVISDIYNEVKAQDNLWSEEIPNGDFVRVTFEHRLTNRNDITIYPKIISGNPKIEVYEIDKNKIIAEFTNLNSNEYNKVYLTSLSEGYSQDSFDLKIIDGDIKINHIIDPDYIIDGINASLVEKESTDVPYSTCTATNLNADDTLYCGNDLSIDGGETGYVNSTHPYNVPSTATINNVTICTRFFLTSKLDDNAADTTKIYVGENSSGSWSYTLIDSCISTGCTTWETEATRCYDVTNTINTPLKASNAGISVYVYQSDADNNQYPSIDQNYVYINYTYTPANTCTPPAGNWEITCSDACVWNTNQAVPWNITATGTGILTLNANFTFTGEKQYVFINPGCQLNINKNGGGFA